MRAADLAMYAAKADGKNRCRRFERAMLTGALDRIELGSDLKVAVDNDELELFYQPILDLTGGRIVGVEALARWTHPDRGPVAPDVFIALAERKGLIVALGRRLVARACAELPRLRDVLGEPALRLSVNLSTRELLEPGLPEAMTAAIAGAGLHPADITVEITESGLMADVERCAAVLHALKGCGVEIALDDFGTGYSSLAYLRHFPVDALKIDKAFMRQVAISGSEDRALVRSIVALGTALGLTVVAEGVEASEQAHAVRALGCHLGQGYLYAAPMAPECLAGALAGAAA